MNDQKLEINTAIQILKPAKEVFESIVDPEKMSNYFISESSGRMEEGKELIWKFPEFDKEFPVKVLKADPYKLISYKGNDSSGKELTVEIRLSQEENNSTVVRVKEGTHNLDEKGLKWLSGNSEGWANFLACLKAYLEYGINLRKGAFEFIRKK